ncbi:PRC-barrel domain-containing protein [Nocardia higoensis]|uniref:PRC-barrel domain-containing protein n=2 Tax=Nocardia higoensis TaxID=228599 RepID=A0ABS0DHE3_9NOCA|nr:PRC-barrel domain-containing protein [Nocardia higoensis]
MIMAQSLLDSVIGSTVLDANGETVGAVEEIYIDDDSGSPTWVAVATDMVEGNSLVPLSGAQHRYDRESLRVQVSKERVRTAPHRDRDGGVSRRAEAELFAHYGIDPRRSGWDTYGRHRIHPGSEEPLTHGPATQPDRHASTRTEPVASVRLRRYVAAER